MKAGNLIRILLGLLVALAGVAVPYRTASAAHTITAADTKAVPRMVSIFGDNTTQSRNSVLGPGWSVLFVKTSGAADTSVVTADLKTFLLSILPDPLPARLSEAAWTAYLTGLETTALTQTASGSGIWRYNLVLEGILGGLTGKFISANIRAMILQGMRLGAKTIPVKVVAHATDVTGSIAITVVDAQIAMASGWNLRSAPLASASNSDTWGEVRALGHEDLTAAQLDARFPQGFFWDATTQAFGSLTTSKALTPLEAIFINATAEDAIGAILNRAGAPSSPSRSLAQNWNSIGTSPDFTVNFTSLYKGKLRGMEKVDVALISLFNAPGAGPPPGYNEVISREEYGPVTTTKVYTYTSGASTIPLFSYDWWFRQPAWTYPRGGVVPAFDADTGNRWMSPFGGYWVSMFNADTFDGLGITPVPDCWLVKLITPAVPCP